MSQRKLQSLDSLDPMIICDPTFSNFDVIWLSQFFSFHGQYQFFQHFIAFISHFELNQSLGIVMVQTIGNWTFGHVVMKVSDLEQRRQKCIWQIVFPVFSKTIEKDNVYCC